MRVSERIYNDMVGHLEQRQPLPFRLTLNDIARYYQVSLTPVRQVVSRLLEEGKLAKLANGRLQRADGISDSETDILLESVLSTGKQEQDLMHKLGEDVIRLSLQGFDGYLREHASARNYGVGRTVIRHVFSELAGRGLLQHVPRCGWRVTSFKSKDMVDYLEVRERLEILALRLAADKLEAGELQQLLSKNRVADKGASAQLDDQLHSLWIERCGNRYIEDFFNRYAPYYRLLFDFAALDEDTKQAMVLEHRQILNSLLEGKLKAAEKALVRHIRDQKKNVEKLHQQLRQTLPC